MTAAPARPSGADLVLADKSRTPRMFTAIARRYDLLNHVLSLNIDRGWRRALVAYAHVHAGDSVLDLATGTGDVALEIARRTGARRIVGADPSSGMLDVFRAKLAGGEPRVSLVEADALDLPFADTSFDAVTIAFGLRNLPDYGRGLSEMTRVLRPGGRVAVLEFLPPRGPALVAYRVYLATLLPVAGRLLSGSREAYAYLSDSIQGFMPEAEVRNLMTGAGLARVESRRLTGGIAALYRGTVR